MGLSENAFRQLLFRSRAAFKKALIGEAESSGLSIAEILSVAARKAAAETGKVASVAGAFLLVLGLSVGIIPNLTSNVAENTVSLPLAASPRILNIEPPTSVPAEKVSESGQSTSEETQPIDLEAIPGKTTGETLISETQMPSEADSLAKATRDAVLPELKSQAAGKKTKESAALILAASNLREAMGSSAAAGLSDAGSTALLSLSYGPAGSLTLDNGAGLAAGFEYDLLSEKGIERAWFTITVQDQEFISAPKVDFSQRTLNPDGTTTLIYIATDLLIGDKSGDYDFVAINDSVVSRSSVQVNLVFDSEGLLIKSSLLLTPRT
jgi:hypothetical protein